MSFWNDKLNGAKPAPVVTTSRDLYGFYNTPAPMQQQQSIPQQQPVEEQYRPEVPLIQGGICPGCGSDRYPPAERVMNGVRQGVCPECGYHPSFRQQGYGHHIGKEQGVKATPARQLDSAGTNLNGQIAQMNANQHNNISNISK